jgi:hypothetical protein
MMRNRGIWYLWFGSVSGLGQSLVEVDMICFSSLTPLFRGVICSTVSLCPRGAETVKTVAIDWISTQLKVLMRTGKRQSLAFITTPSRR